MEFYRQEYGSGLPFPSAGDLPNPGIEPGSPKLQAASLPSEPPGRVIQPTSSLQQKDAIFFISFFLIFIFSKESIFQYVELCVQCYEMKILNNIFMAFSQSVVKKYFFCFTFLGTNPFILPCHYVGFI